MTEDQNQAAAEQTAAPVDPAAVNLPISTRTVKAGCSLKAGKAARVVARQDRKVQKAREVLERAQRAEAAAIEAREAAAQQQADYEARQAAIVAAEAAHQQKLQQMAQERAAAEAAARDEAAQQLTAAQDARAAAQEAVNAALAALRDAEKGVDTAKTTGQNKIRSVADEHKTKAGQAVAAHKANIKNTARNGVASEGLGA